MTTNDIRREFAELYLNNQFVTNPRDGKRMLEIIGASFLATEPTIFGTPNAEYLQAELNWYKSMSLNIHDIYKGAKPPPKAWVFTANQEGLINSNYGYLIWSEDNYSQYVHARDELKRDPCTRRATMIYQRPSMWYDWRESSKNDFVCTNAVTYYIRQGALHCVVQMRSNDIWAGYRNDYFWQAFVLEQLATELGVKPGRINWQVQNLHCYEHNFYLIDHYSKTREHSISKSEFRRKSDAPSD